ncbi:MAG: acetyl-CoA carboxylase biotin carboxyl carrier protein [Chitinophagia bacterium]|jgi:acetyl-CoA carboxylase biotin carboxyl carrier protein
MDLKQIHELIKIINKSNIGEISIEDKDGKVTIRQKEEPAIVQSAPVQQVYHTTPAQAPASVPPAPVVTSAPASQAGTPVNEKLVTVKSPMIGTFYRRSSPDKPVLADIGQAIAPGKVLCIIEAMKLFNEIEAEISGTIVKVLVDDASPVEFDQPLFLVDPTA